VRFTGQVRVPEVDHPGIPATIVVEDGLAEVLLEGESLGRWSLYDVQAARLVSSAFSISLDGEELTFIADEPVDFAYKGVEHMAGVWARYKAMSIPRRAVAVGRSRRGTTPSRIPELREAMMSNLRSDPTAFMPPSPAVGAAAPEPQTSPWAKRLEAYSNVPPPIADADEIEDTEAVAERQTADQLEPIETEAVPTEQAAVVPTESETVVPTEPDEPAPPPRMRPGPGLIPRQVTRIAPVPSSLSDEPLDWETAWEEPPIFEESYEEPPSDANLVLVEDEPERDEPQAVGEEAMEPIEERVDAVMGIEEPVEDDPAQEDPGGSSEDDPEAVVSEEPAHSAARDEIGVPNEVVLDLGDLEADQRVSNPAAVAVADHSHPGGEMLEPDLELLFAGASMPESERGGLFGAVRSAFTRNRGGVHEHEFVEAPGGIGIVRQICAECGYISIGVSD
jgi:hypothetical protein